MVFDVFVVVPASVVVGRVSGLIVVGISDKVRDSVMVDALVLVAASVIV